MMKHREQDGFKPNYIENVSMSENCSCLSRKGFDLCFLYQEKLPTFSSFYQLFFTVLVFHFFKLNCRSLHPALIITTKDLRINIKHIFLTF